jgi:ferredoxin
MRIEVDADKCIASGQCVLIAPEVFDQDDQGYVIVLDDSPGNEFREAMEEAVLICPAAVIRIVEE